MSKQSNKSLDLTQKEPGKEEEYIETENQHLSTDYEQESENFYNENAQNFEQGAEQNDYQMTEDQFIEQGTVQQLEWQKYLTAQKQQQKPQSKQALFQLINQWQHIAMQFMESFQPIKKFKNYTLMELKEEEKITKIDLDKEDHYQQHKIWNMIQLKRMKQKFMQKLREEQPVTRQKQKAFQEYWLMQQQLSEQQSIAETKKILSIISTTHSSNVPSKHHLFTLFPQSQPMLTQLETKANWHISPQNLSKFLYYRILLKVTDFSHCSTLRITGVDDEHMEIMKDVGSVMFLKLTRLSIVRFESGLNLEFLAFLNAPMLDQVNISNCMISNVQSLSKTLLNLRQLDLKNNLLRDFRPLHRLFFNRKTTQKAFLIFSLGNEPLSNPLNDISFLVKLQSPENNTKVWNTINCLVNNCKKPSFTRQEFNDFEQRKEIVEEKPIRPHYNLMRALLRRFSNCTSDSNYRMLNWELVLQ